MGGIRRSIGLLIAAATVAGSLTLATPAVAAEPTRVQDTSTAVQIAAVNGDSRMRMSPAFSDRSTVEVAGTYAITGAGQRQEESSTTATSTS
jgi:hypothetical protein